MKRRRPAIQITDPAFVWIKADTHTDPELFRARQRERIARVQAKPANVASIGKRKATA